MSAELLTAFLSDMADSIRVWERDAAEKLDAGDDPHAVIHGSLTGLAHSFLVILDGGTKLSDDGRVVFLTDNEGQVVSEGLHEYLFDFIEP
ncbi:MAG TPA: hypothetical protein VFH70_03100 [Acidimicrobiales bacterium]|nr:hypothetical protein [Acidimicrobiales bacterium]